MFYPYLRIQERRAIEGITLLREMSFCPDPSQAPACDSPLDCRSFRASCSQSEYFHVHSAPSRTSCARLPTGQSDAPFLRRILVETSSAEQRASLSEQLEMTFSLLFRNFGLMSESFFTAKILFRRLDIIPTRICF